MSSAEVGLPVWVWAPLTPPHAVRTRCRVIGRVACWLELQPPSEPCRWVHQATVLPARTPILPPCWADSLAESRRLNPSYFWNAGIEPE
jgi:hypothetical protein